MIYIITIMLVVWYAWLRRLSLSTADGAIVMALGIMINGMLEGNSFFGLAIGPYVTVVLLLLLFWLMTGYIKDVFSNVFYQRHIKHPITSFATGTWVAAVSVTIILIARELPELRFFAMILFFFNLLLWVVYFGLIIRNCRYIFRHPVFLNGSHGVILLACVATQSIVVAGSQLLGISFPPVVSLVMIILGVVLYGLGLILICVRYIWRNHGHLTEDWQNTNCIIHGALSITGLASEVSHVVSANLIVVIWLAVCLLFIGVEYIEILRGMKRIQRFGWGKGIFTYSSSQWARNFTFGMFLVFTAKLPLGRSFLANSVLAEHIKAFIVTWWIYLVIGLFIVETVLFLRNLRCKNGKETGI